MRRLLGLQLFGMALALALALGAVGPAAPAFADQRDFTLLNNTGQTIYELYVSPTKDDDWGDDILGDDVLMDGTTVTVRFDRFSAGRCFYDIKVVTASGDEGVLTEVNLCEVGLVTFR
jgi:hypothetical protein